MAQDPRLCMLVFVDCGLESRQTGAAALQIVRDEFPGNALRNCNQNRCRFRFQRNHPSEGSAVSTAGFRAKNPGLRSLARDRGAHYRVCLGLASLFAKAVMLAATRLSTSKATTGVRAF